MKSLENYFSVFLSYQNLGDCSLCEIPETMKLSERPEKFQKNQKKQLIHNNLLKKVSMYLSMPVVAAYILVIQLIGD